MELTIELIKPYTEQLESGALKQVQLAKDLGVPQSRLSWFMNKFMPEVKIGRGGVFPMTPEMAAAVEEALPFHANVAHVARRHGVDYLALVRRIRKRRLKVKEDLPPAHPKTAEELTAKLGFPVKVGADEPATEGAA